jgi:hypothetical protein
MHFMGHQDSFIGSQADPSLSAWNPLMAYDDTRCRMTRVDDVKTRVMLVLLRDANTYDTFGLGIAVPFETSSRRRLLKE